MTQLWEVFNLISVQLNMSVLSIINVTKFCCDIRSRRQRIGRVSRYLFLENLPNCEFGTAITPKHQLPDPSLHPPNGNFRFDQQSQRVKKLKPPSLLEAKVPATDFMQLTSSPGPYISGVSTYYMPDMTDKQTPPSTYNIPSSQVSP